MTDDAATPDDGLNHTVFLVRRAKGGDQDAFTALYERHYSRVRRSAALRMGRTVRQCEDDIDDVVQETFAYAFHRLAKGEFDECRSEAGFRNWLASHIVENKIRDRARRRSTRKRGAGAEKLMRDIAPTSDDEIVLAGHEPRPSQHANIREMEERVEQALLGLGERHRTVIDLRDNCEMSFEEIAVEMGYTKTATMRSLYHRARQELQQRLEKSMPGWESYF